MFACILMVAFTSLSIDYGTVQLCRMQLQTGVDAAALAGATGLAVSPAEARSRAKLTAAANPVGGRPLVLLDSDIELGTWNATLRTFTVLTGSAESQANSVRIKGQLTDARGTSVPLPFMSTFTGKKYQELVCNAISTSAVDSADVVIAQDVSGSFANELNLAKSGDQALLNSLNVTGSKSRCGLVAFAGDAITVKSLLPVTANIYALSKSINSISVSILNVPSTLSGTDISTGIKKARQLILSADSPPNDTRCIVIVSDGEPSPSLLGAHPLHSASELMNLARSEADIAWANGIHVYVVFWNSENSATAAANLKSLIRGRGTFTNVTDPAKLPDAIGLLLKSQVRLVR